MVEQREVLVPGLFVELVGEGRRLMENIQRKYILKSTRRLHFH
jgi:hypothetical protein